MTQEQKINEVMKARAIIDSLKDQYKETEENFEINKALIALQALSVYLTKL